MPNQVTESTDDSKMWVVRWEDGRTVKFYPYSSYEIQAFIIAGLLQGKVTVNKKEVELELESTRCGWHYKEAV